MQQTVKNPAPVSIALLARDRGFKNPGSITLKKKGMSNGMPWYKVYITCEQIQAWLRNTHNIDMEVYLVIMEHNRNEVFQNSEVKEYTYRVYKEGITQFISLIADIEQEDKSHKKAMEDGIMYCLQNLVRPIKKPRKRRE